MPKRAIHYASKALRLPKISEKEKFILSMYKVDATVQLGNSKAAVLLLKELPKLEASFKCSFGSAAPWVDQSTDYSAKFLLQANFAGAGLADDTETQSKEMTETLKTLGELNDSKALKGVTPIASNLLYSYLRRGNVRSSRPAQVRAPVLETPQTSNQANLKPTLTNVSCTPFRPRTLGHLAR
jgi:hypothetical protein